MLIRFLWLFSLFFSLSFSTTLEIKQGWQLVGVPASLDVKSSFNTKYVDIVWGFDGVSQSWRGYSPNSETQEKIVAQYAALNTLEPWQAMWVYSNSDWKLTFEDSALPGSPDNNAITLNAGWNLVAIPQQSVVSDAFFGDAVVWKYSSEEAWSVNDDALNFPPIETISTSEGLWVKSAVTRSIDVTETLSKLQTFSDETSMLAYIRKMVQMNNYGYYGWIERPFAMDDALEDATNSDGAPVPSVPSNDLSGTESDAGGSDKVQDATTTNLQEAGVDESDILKHNNNHIFNVDNSNGNIVVTSFANIAQKNYTPIATIGMPNKNVVAMFLQNNRLNVISNTNYYYMYDTPVIAEDGASDAAGNTTDAKRVAIMPDYYSSQKFTLDIFDVSNVNNIVSVATHEIDGYYQDSRLIDGRLFLISQFSPQIQYEYPKIYVATLCSQIDQNEIYGYCNGTAPMPVEPECTPGGAECIDIERPSYEEYCEYGEEYKLWNDNNCYQYSYDANGAWKYDYDHPIIVSENLIPKILSNGTEAALVTPSKFYAPLKLDQRANITSISSFNSDSGTRYETLSFLGNTHTYYASTSSLYLVSSEYPLYYDYSHYKEQQMIYKFSLGSALAYEGRGFVEGNMLNQFSMSEQNEYLRVATTSGWAWWNEGEITNSVYTLRNSDENLEVVGTLSGLGHEGERIRAVRFMGNRGFVVTFRQTDPLYTLDLSDPTVPRKIGELSIPGFSTYLHVVDENRVLSIGRNADASGRSAELQLQLFNITDFAQPQLADKILIGDASTYSEAEYNHKAFAYRASDMMFGMPYRSYNYYDDYKGSSEKFGIYQVEGMKINAIDTIVSDGSDWGNVGRGLIFDLNNNTYGALLKGSNIVCDTVK